VDPHRRDDGADVVQETKRVLSIPLWLLAFLCLAWPVTSFLLARRRRGRGFEVEMTNDQNQNDESMTSDQ
jgi:hypothetical protein